MYVFLLERTLTEILSLNKIDLFFIFKSYQQTTFEGKRVKMSDLHKDLST